LSYRPRTYQDTSIIPEGPLPFSVLPLERETRLDAVGYSSIRSLNSLLQAEEITIPEIKKLLLERQTKLEKYNFIVSDTHELVNFEAAILHDNYQRNHFTFFTYGLKDQQSLCRGDVHPTDGSLLMSLFGTQPPHSRLRRLLIEKRGLFIGTTSLPEFGHKADTINRVIGLTRNPHDPNLTIGGSSGGSAGAVATGLAHIGFATDAAGSITIPGAFAGVVGVKPNRNFTVCGEKLGFGPMACKGWFSRTVEDSAVLVDTLDSSLNYVNQLDHDNFSTFKIAYLPFFDYTVVESPILEGIRNSVRKIQEDLKIDIPEFRNLGFNDPSWAADIHWLGQYADHYIYLEAMFKQKAETKGMHWESLLDDSTLKIMKEGKKLTLDEKSKSKLERDAVASALDKFFDTYDFLITPATPVLPWEAGKARPSSYDGRARSAHTPFSYVFNYSQNPSIVLPCTIHPTSERYAVPIGLQIVSSKRRSLLELFQIAKKLESIFQYYKPLRFNDLSVQSTPTPIKVVVSDITQDLNTNISDFRAKVEQKFKIVVDRLIYKHAVLGYNTTLSSYGVVPSSVIVALPETCSGLM
jgi:Asp-tRNA(Asn)/Glu-tRNA(Gln) amidotransferase A subunit family amidase